MKINMRNLPYTDVLNLPQMKANCNKTGLKDLCLFCDKYWTFVTNVV